MNEPCPVMASLNQHMHMLERNEKREAELRREWPLSEFEAAAWDNFWTQGELEDIVLNHPRLVALALAQFVDHPAATEFRTRDDYGNHLERMTIWRRIDEYLTDTAERLQDKFIEREMFP